MEFLRVEAQNMGNGTVKVYGVITDGGVELRATQNYSVQIFPNEKPEGFSWRIPSARVSGRDAYYRSLPEAMRDAGVMAEKRAGALMAQLTREKEVEEKSKDEVEAVIRSGEFEHWFRPIIGRAQDKEDEDRKPTNEWFYP